MTAREAPTNMARMTTAKPTPPSGGEKITLSQGRLQVPDRPIIPFIEGDGIGPDIWAAARAVLDAAVKKTFGGRRSISWMQILAGEKAQEATDSYLPDETVEAIREYLIAIKGPLTTPVGGGFRSLNVSLRQILESSTVLPVCGLHPGMKGETSAVTVRDVLLDPTHRVYR